MYMIYVCIDNTRGSTGGLPVVYRGFFLLLTSITKGIPVQFVTFILNAGLSEGF